MGKRLGLETLPQKMQVLEFKFRQIINLVTDACNLLDAIRSEIYQEDEETHGHEPSEQSEDR